LWRSAVQATDKTRKAYIAALKKADEHDFASLLAFFRS
jgi:O-acetyl-ADP-ribose deacetylase (regulator of RNase III)